MITALWNLGAMADARRPSTSYSCARSELQRTDDLWSARRLRPYQLGNDRRVGTAKRVPALPQQRSIGEGHMSYLEGAKGSKAPREPKERKEPREQRAVEGAGGFRRFPSSALHHPPRRDRRHLGRRCGRIRLDPARTSHRRHCKPEPLGCAHTPLRFRIGVAVATLLRHRHRGECAGQAMGDPLGAGRDNRRDWFDASDVEDTTPINVPANAAIDAGWTTLVRMQAPDNTVPARASWFCGTSSIWWPAMPTCELTAHARSSRK